VEERQNAEYFVMEMATPKISDRAPVNSERLMKQEWRQRARNKGIALSLARSLLCCPTLPLCGCDSGTCLCAQMTLAPPSACLDTAASEEQLADLHEPVNLFVDCCNEFGCVHGVLRPTLI
jgi:hypothetical protein